MRGLTPNHCGPVCPVFPCHELARRQPDYANFGPVGHCKDGNVPHGTAELAAICFENIRAILDQAGMGPHDICHISAWLTDSADLAAYMAARDAFLAGIVDLPASTLLLVAGFSRPEFKVEVEVMAAAL